MGCSNSGRDMPLLPARAWGWGHHFEKGHHCEGLVGGGVKKRKSGVGWSPPTPTPPPHPPIFSPRAPSNRTHPSAHACAGGQARAHLHPLLELRAVREDLHARLGVRVVRGLEAQRGQAQAREELLQDADQVAQRQPAVAHQPCARLPAQGSGLRGAGFCGLGSPTVQQSAPPRPVCVDVQPLQIYNVKIMIIVPVCRHHHKIITIVTKYAEI